MLEEFLGIPRKTPKSQLPESGTQPAADSRTKTAEGSGQQTFDEKLEVQQPMGAEDKLE